MSVDLPDRGIETWEVCSDHGSYPLIFNEIKRNLGYSVISLCRVRAWGHGYIGYDPTLHETRIPNSTDLRVFSNTIEELAVLRYICGMSTSLKNFKMCLIDGFWKIVSFEIKPDEVPKINLPKFLKTKGSYQRVIKRILRRLQIDSNNVFDARMRYLIHQTCDTFDDFDMSVRAMQGLTKVFDHVIQEEELLKQYDPEDIANESD